MRVYLDVCCLNRPFDDQTQERIHLETEAIETVLTYVERGLWQWVGSNLMELEAMLNSDVERRFRVLRLMVAVQEHVAVESLDHKRAGRLVELGFKAMDALHVACAERARVDVFLTTDDRLIKTAARQAEVLRMPVANPLKWLEEQLL